MINKWYFCLSEASIDRAHHGWREMVFAAVNSARIHTNLKPILLFDGEENEFVDALRKKGVEIINTSLSTSRFETIIVANNPCC